VNSCDLSLFSLINPISELLLTFMLHNVNLKQLLGFSCDTCYHLGQLRGMIFVLSPLPVRMSIYFKISRHKRSSRNPTKKHSELLTWSLTLEGRPLDLRSVHLVYFLISRHKRSSRKALFVNVSSPYCRVMKF